MGDFNIMGFFATDHIKRFCKNRTIKEIDADSTFGLVYIRFTDDTYIRLDQAIREISLECGCKTKRATNYVVPYDKNDEVIQSMAIDRGEWDS